LNKGLKYNLHAKQKNWINKLALETETVISLLGVSEQNYVRHANQIKKLINKDNQRDRAAYC
jgi:hypothetical protein